MKKLLILSLVVAFALLGAQAFASPPVKPPVEGFIISSFTEITCTMTADGKGGNVSESENYDWTYFEGTGRLNNEYTTLADAVNWLLAAYGDLADINPNDPFQPIPAWVQPYVDYVLAHAGDMILLAGQGFQEGAQIAYQQEFNALSGSTYFKKDFKAVSNTTTADPDNLAVEKTINYENIDATGAKTAGNATHEEKVGLNVVSVGSAGGDPVAAATSLLHLCPWATESSGSTPGYPPTNEGIAAASSFDVTKINFKSTTSVNTVNNPALAYNVFGEGEGTIKAGFVVDLWEGREGDVWGTTQPHQPWLDLIEDLHAIHGININLHPDIVWVLEGEPDLASRTTYEEHASAEGVFKFTKNVSYQSVMPGGVAASTIPIQNVP